MGGTCMAYFKYQGKIVFFRCILIDFLGNGRSDRLEKFFGKSFIRKKECQNECTVETVL